ncbi:sensor histidine kinase [Reichenbachiella versicolor]|uniref:sensor histidine kinase n=1 Tax=Reichenbachiella versicolor TaxID=1821036 RepID=UPI000D6E98AD|nr:histidine kinase [Reichenbachiella versicolor]
MRNSLALANKEETKKMTKTKTKKFNWWRWVSIIVMGLSIRFFSDFIYSIVYRQAIVWDTSSYLMAILMSLLILEGIRHSDRLLDKVFSWDKSYSTRFLVQLLSNASLTLAVVSIFGFFLQDLMIQHPARPIFEDVVIITTTLSVTSLMVAIDLVIFFLRRWQKSVHEVERFKKESLEFRHEMLKTQVNPHFLFNSLNTLSSLVYTDQDAAYNFIRKLSNVYRNVLEHRNKGLVTVKEELEAIKSYVDLIRLRFGEKLNLSIDIPEEIECHQVPPLILQLLIENAIKHNVVSTKYPLTVEVYLEKNRIVIRNTLRLKTSKGYSSKIGLDNIISHYDIVTDQKVTIEQTNDYFTVTIPILDPNYEGIDYRR